MTDDEDADDEPYEDWIADVKKAEATLHALYEDAPAGSRAAVADALQSLDEAKTMCRAIHMGVPMDRYREEE